MREILIQRKISTDYIMKVNTFMTKTNSQCEFAKMLSHYAISYYLYTLLEIDDYFNTNNNKRTSKYMLLH